jgi:Cu(I)/Ag(I) efflux system membrane protein CusA/SilA
MIGGMVSSTLLTLIVIPAIYALVKTVGVRRHGEGATALGYSSVTRERPGPAS